MHYYRFHPHVVRIKVTTKAGTPLKDVKVSAQTEAGAAVLDVGVSRDENGKIVGDVHPGVAEVAGWLSPNPGGVGPMTRALLLWNVVAAAEAAGSVG